MNRFIGFIIIVSVFLLGCGNEKVDEPVARKGVIDLRGWNFKNDGNVKLEGEWEFYWKQLIKPEDLDKHSAEKQYFNVPYYWNFKSVGNNNLTGTGYATYRLTILHDKTDEDLALFLGEQMTAYRFWCDTTEVFSCGKVADNAIEAKPSLMPIVRAIRLSENTTQFVFQISNFHHSQGGLYTAPVIGDHHNIHDRENKRFAFNMFLIGGILLMAFYHFGVAFFRRGDIAPLLLALFAITLSIVTAFTGYNFGSTILPHMSWAAHYRIEYVTIYIAAALLAGFIQKIYSKDISERQTLLYIGLTLFSLLTVFLPTRLFTCMFISGVLIIGSTVFYIFILVKQVTNKRHGSGIFLFSFFIYLLSVTNDVILVKTLFIWDIELIPLGTLLFILGQSLVYARIAVKTLTQNKILSKRLKENNIEISNINKDLEEQTLNLQVSEAKMRNLFRLLPEAVFEFDNKGNITFANDEFYRQLFFMPQNSLNIEDLVAKSDDNDISFIEFITSTIEHTQNIRELRVNLVRSDESTFPASVSIARVMEKADKESFRGIFLDISQRVTDEDIIDKAFNEIRQKNQSILDSLKYASTIQNAVMPTQDFMDESFKEYFIINKPHSIVSGDFYYVNKKDKKVIFALSDCTGHGVPGGFMTMLGITLLNEMYGGEGIPKPNKTLDKM